jgi:competence protein ComEC
LAEAAIPASVPAPGSHATVGGLDLEVLGPLRRYASPNDQSIVLRVETGSYTVLFSGDIEVIAQQELAGVRADVLKVPHQGAATSDADWLAAVGARIASISVGPNTFGHPADWVIDVLEDSGAVVMRTDRDGDVVVGPDGMLSDGAQAWPPW